MKTCPKCNTQYADDTLSFCLNDGTPLSGSATDSPTVVFNESETVVRNASQSGPDRQESQVTHYIPQQSTAPPPVQASSGGKNTMIVLLLAALGLFAVVGIAAVGGYIYFNSTGSSASLTNTNASNTPTRMPEASKSPATPSPTATVGKPTPSPIAAPSANTTVTDGQPATSFTSKRLQFPNGAYAANVNDVLEVGEQRTYLVACKAGQTLNTRIEKGLPCVTYSNTGSALRWVTFAGDNKVTIRNNCSGKSPFVMSVSVV